MMQIKTVYANGGHVMAIDEAINLELRRLGKKAFAIQYHHWFSLNEKGENSMRVMAHIQYEEDET